MVGHATQLGMVPLSRKEFPILLLAAVLLALWLNTLFLPASSFLHHFWIKEGPAALFLAALLYAATPKPPPLPKREFGPIPFLQLCLLPWLVSLALRPWSGTVPISERGWILLYSPCYEELLFRGFSWNLFWYRDPRPLTWTNPLPSPLFFSSIVFALWHLQNWIAIDLNAAVQIIGYFLVGIWLGYLRFQSGGILYPILGHFVVNLMGVRWCS